jgi:hypothetical protein
MAEGTLTQETEKKLPEGITTAAALIDDQAKKELATAVVSQTTSVLNPVEHEQLRKLSKEYFLSNAYPESYKNPEQIMMAMIMGRSMGMTPHESVVNGYFVRGMYNVFGKALPASLRRHGWTWHFKDETAEQCSVVLRNTRTEEVIEDTFLYEDAVSSGFTKDSGGREKFGWKAGANRKRKLRYGVLSQVVHTYIPDVLGAVVGIAEYSEDYGDAQQNHDTDKNVRRQAQMERAAQQRASMNDGAPQVIDPIEADDIDMKVDAESALSQEEGA